MFQPGLFERTRTNYRLFTADSCDSSVMQFQWLQAFHSCELVRYKLPYNKHPYRYNPFTLQGRR